MSSYQGRHADLYDILYADKDYPAETVVVDGLLKRYGAGHVRYLLELACGTGSHALRLSNLGYEVVASDYSPDMLRVAVGKGASSGSRVRFVLQDMRHIETPDRAFDAVICLFDSIGYVQTNAAIAQVLSGVHRVLRRDGLFLFEFWHAAAMLKSFDPVRVRRFATPRGDLLRISHTSLDVAAQLATVSYELIELGTDGWYSRLNEAQTNRYFQLQEMAAFLDNAGLRLEAAFAGFSGSEVIDDSTWHILAVASKP